MNTSAIVPPAAPTVFQLTEPEACAFIGETVTSVHCSGCAVSFGGMLRSAEPLVVVLELAIVVSMVGVLLVESSLVLTETPQVATLVVELTTVVVVSVES